MSATGLQRVAELADLGDICPLTGSRGTLINRREAVELVALYASHFEIVLPRQIQDSYFRFPINEYYCATSGLRWYSPTLLGDSNFYQFLETIPWYYDTEAWDKVRTVELLDSIKQDAFVDIGCGSGLLLQMAQARGLNGFGVETNPTAVLKGKKKGLQLYLPEDPELTRKQAAVTVALHTLEHVNDPVGWLQDQLVRFKSRYAIIAVPCHDTLLGKTSDPLCWPPHHATFWSGRALRVLANRLGYRVVKLEYEPNSWERFQMVLNREQARKLAGLPRFPEGRIGRQLFRLLSLLRIAWIRRAHTALALMEKEP